MLFHFGYCMNALFLWMEMETPSNEISTIIVIVSIINWNFNMFVCSSSSAAAAAANITISKCSPKSDQTTKISIYLKRNWRKWYKYNVFCFFLAHSVRGKMKWYHIKPRTYVRNVTYRPAENRTQLAHTAANAAQRNHFQFLRNIKYNEMRESKKQFQIIILFWLLVSVLISWYIFRCFTFFLSFDSKLWYLFLYIPLWCYAYIPFNNFFSISWYYLPCSY